MRLLKSALLSGGAAALLGAGLLASALLRIPYYQHDLIFVDEGIYASTAAELVAGKTLYRDVWCNHMPLAVRFCEGMFRVFGVNSLAMHAGSLLLALVQSLLLYALGSRFFSPRVGGIAALAYAIISTNFYTPRIIGYTAEQPAAVFITASVLIFLCALEEGRQGGFFWAGVLSAAAVFAKPSAAPEALMFAAFMLLSRRRPRKAGSILRLALGWAAGLAALLLPLYVSGALDAWWTQSVLTRVDYVNQIPFRDWARIAARQPLGFGLIYLWLWILLGSGRAGIRAGGEAGRFLWIWLAASFVGVAMGRRFYANYYIQMFPVLSWMAACALDRMLRDGIRRRHRTAVWSAAALLAATFGYIQARTAAHWYFFLDRAAHERTTLWDMCVIDRDFNELSLRIRSATNPGDRIFVWGPNAAFYFLSGRRMATLYPFFDVMDPAQPPYGDEEYETLRRLLEDPPALIVDHFKTVKMSDRPGWDSLLSMHYRLLARGREVRLYIRKDKTQALMDASLNAGS